MLKRKGLLLDGLKLEQEKDTVIDSFILYPKSGVYGWQLSDIKPYINLGHLVCIANCFTPYIYHLDSMKYNQLLLILQLVLACTNFRR